MSDHDLHDEGISRLYHMGDRSEPPTHLDESIRKVAHSAVHRPRLTLFWRLTATAAVLVLSVGVFLRTLETVPLEDEFAEPTPTLPGTPQATGTPSTGESELLEERKPVTGEPAPRSPAAPQSMERREEAFSSMSLPTTDEVDQAVETESLSIQEKAAVPRAADEMAPAKQLKLRKAAPAVGRMVQPLEEMMYRCGELQLSASDTEQSWLELAKRLKRSGEQEKLDCLARAYRERFDRELEL
ncbi:MAG: hypothetical protein ABW074_13170 [Sedimenticola sp.]